MKTSTSCSEKPGPRWYSRALLSFFLFGFLNVSAQSLTGLWVGNLRHDSNSIRQDQSFEIALTEYRGKVYGYSRSEFIINDTLYYILKRVKGTIKGDVCEVTDDEIVSYNFRGKLDKGVKVTSTFRRNQSDSTWYLDGTWKTKATREFYAVTGKVSLEEEKDLSASKIFPHLEELNKADQFAFYQEKKAPAPAAPPRIVKSETELAGRLSRLTQQDPVSSLAKPADGPRPGITPPPPVETAVTQPASPAAADNAATPKETATLTGQTDKKTAETPRPVDNITKTTQTNPGPNVDGSAQKKTEAPATPVSPTAAVVTPPAISNQPVSAKTAAETADVKTTTLPVTTTPANTLAVKETAPKEVSDKAAVTENKITPPVNAATVKPPATPVTPTPPANTLAVKETAPKQAADKTAMTEKKVPASVNPTIQTTSAITKAPAATTTTAARSVDKAPTTAALPVSTTPARKETITTPAPPTATVQPPSPVSGNETKAAAPATVTAPTPTAALSQPATDVVPVKAQSNPQQNDMVAGRRSEYSQQVTFSADSLRIVLFDNGEIDGDTVSVYLNGELIMPHQGLKASAIRKTIAVPREVDSFAIVMFAESLGTRPPNTGLLVVHDGEDVYYVRFSSDFQKSTGILFKRKQ